MPKIIRIYKGREEIVEEGCLSKLNNRIKQLRISGRRGIGRRRHNPVTYRIGE